MDISTGPSPYVVFAVDQGIKILGSDPDPYMAGIMDVSPHVREMVEDGRSSLMLCDGRKLPLPDNYFDHVLSISTIAHVPGDGDLAMMREVSRVLAPGSRAVITTEGYNQPVDYWEVQPFYTGHQYDPADERMQEMVHEGQSIGYYRLYNEESLRDRLGNMEGLVLVESGFLVNRLVLRGYFSGCPR